MLSTLAEFEEPVGLIKKTVRKMSSRQTFVKKKKGFFYTSGAASDFILKLVTNISTS